MSTSKPAAREKSEQANRNQAVLEVICSASERLAQASNWKGEVPELFEKLSWATKSDQVSVFQASPEGDRIALDCIACWSTEDRDSPLNNNKKTTVPLHDFESLNFDSYLRRGRTVQLVRSTLPPHDQERLDMLRARSLVAVPVFSGGELWGVLTLANFQEETPWTEVEVNALKIAANVLGMAIVRKKARDDLRRVESNEQLMMESAPEHIVVLDTEGTVTAINEAAANYLGRSRSDLIGLTANDLFPADVAERRRQINERALRTGQSVQYIDENWGRRFDCTVQPLFDEQGVPDRLLIHAQDVTKAYEDERLASLTMTISGVAHHIKNVQTCLNGSLHILDKAIAHGDLEKIREVWPVLRRSSSRVDRLVKNLLAISRSTTQKSVEEINVNEFIREMLGDYWNSFVDEESGIELLINMNESCGTITADPMALHDVVLNLFCNALEVLESMREGTISVSTHASEDECHIRISDDGPGIPPNVLEQIFDPFFTTKGKKGTGLGLAVVKRIVDEQGWEIHVHSELNQGTSFEISIPLESRELPEVKQPPHQEKAPPLRRG